MGTGWRRAFCTTAQRERDSMASDDQSKCGSQIPSPRSCAKMNFLSNPSTPSLRCRTTIAEAVLKSSGSDDSPKKLECKTNTPKSAKFAAKSPRGILGSNPSSPRSPFSILRNSLRLSRNSCGVCLQSVKTGQGMAIYTAECSHSFHFPCIAAHVSKNASLVCPVCCSNWTDVPLLAVHKIQPQSQAKQDSLIQTQITKPREPTHQQPQSIQTQNTKPREPTHHQPQFIQTQNTKPEPTHQQPQSATVNLKQQHNDRFNARAYNDDEPLLSPTTGGRGGGFVPIPEGEDEEDDEVEEFQGFFVNPVHSSSDEVTITGQDSRTVEVSLAPEAAVVSVGRSYEAYAVVFKVKAPLLPPQRIKTQNSNNSSHFLNAARRAPIDLVTVLDVSASMSGAKLQMMKRAMRLVISSLGSADRLSIISFSACPKRLMPLRRMTAQGQRAARRIIDRLGCRQGTSVADALKKAAKVLEDRRERNPVATIMLLSDGQDEKVHSNNANQRHGSAHVSSTRFSHVEIPVHSSGFGAKASAGYNREPSEDAFTKCVGGLLSVVVQDLRIELGFASGSDPAEIAAIYSCNGKPASLGSSLIRLGDLYAEEERELLVELRVPAPVVGSHHVLSVRCNYRDPLTKEIITGREQALLVPRAESVRSSNLKIERMRNLFITTRAIAESRQLIESNDLTRAHQLLASARALVVQSSSVSEYVAGLEAELAEVQWRRQLENNQVVVQRRKEVAAAVVMTDENGEPLTPTSAWRAAEQLAKVAIMKKSLNRVSDLHGFENARF